LPSHNPNEPNIEYSQVARAQQQQRRYSAWRGYWNRQEIAREQWGPGLGGAWRRRRSCQAIAAKTVASKAASA